MGTARFVPMKRKKIRDNPEDFNQPNVRKNRGKKEVFKGVEVEDDFKVINEKMSSASVVTDLEGLMWNP